MRILHVFDHSAPLHSGYAFRSLAILRAQRSFGWETAHVTSSRQGATEADIEQAAGFSFHRTRVARPKIEALPVLGEIETMCSLKQRILECAREFKPDVVHAHSPVLNAIPAISACKQLGLPIVYEMRSLWEDSFVAKGRGKAGSVRYRATRALETYALRRCDAVIGISQGLIEEIEKRGVSAERIVHVPNGVDLAHFPLNRAYDSELAKRLAVSDSPVFGYAGSLHAYEGLDLLIDAFAVLWKNGSNAQLLILGDGDEAHALVRQVQELGLEKRVRLLGQVPHDDIPRYLSIMHALVYPRRESRLTRLVTPLKPLEAMAQGVPVIASDIGGHRELVRDGKTGRMVKEGSALALAKAIEAAVDSIDSSQIMAENARQYVASERTWSATIALTADAYRQAGAAFPTNVLMAEEVISE